MIYNFRVELFILKNLEKFWIHKNSQILKLITKFLTGQLLILPTDLEASFLPSFYEQQTNLVSSTLAVCLKTAQVDDHIFTPFGETFHWLQKHFTAIRESFPLLKSSIFWNFLYIFFPIYLKDLFFLFCLIKVFLEDSSCVI